MAMTGAAALRTILAVACCLGPAACGSRHALMAAPASSASAATPSGTRTRATSSTPAGPSHIPVCRTSQLKIAIVRSMAAGGTAGAYLGFTSHTRRRCILRGWPTLVGVTAAGNTSTAIRRLTMMFGPDVNGVPVVTLKPGALAVAVVTVEDGRPPACPPSYRLLRITPPGNDRPTVISGWLDHPYVHGYLPACTRLWISPVVPAHDVYMP